MEINKKENKFTYVTFGELKDGETFIDPKGVGDDTVVLIKLGIDWDDVLRNPDENFDWIAARLDNGNIYGYKNDEEVVRADVTATFTTEKKGD